MEDPNPVPDQPPEDERADELAYWEMDPALIEVVDHEESADSPKP